MKEILLIKNGEIALKGLNRGKFEDTLIGNINKVITKHGKFSIRKSQSTIYITPKQDDIDLDDVSNDIKKVFGIAAFSRCIVIEKDIEEIKKHSVLYLSKLMNNTNTFKIVAKRADKNFPFKSPQLQQILGDTFVTAFPHLKVDVHNPEITVTIEIRDKNAYIHAKIIKGAGGMPVGCSGDGMLLISGGIDSPVAGYMMAKRGLRLSAIHFIAPPYTSEKALEKVETLCKKITDYTGSIRFYCVPFTDVQLAIKKYCPEELFTIIMRRIMMQITLKICEEQKIPVMITGESLGQVASQTINAIVATDDVSNIPIFRPLIGMDKCDIIEIARKIETFEISILPYEDCCTVFTPKRPKTHPTLDYVNESHSLYNFDELIEQAINKTTSKVIR